MLRRDLDQQDRRVRQEPATPGADHELRDVHQILRPVGDPQRRPHRLRRGPPAQKQSGTKLEDRGLSPENRRRARRTPFDSCGP